MCWHAPSTALAGGAFCESLSQPSSSPPAPPTVWWSRTKSAHADLTKLRSITGSVAAWSANARTTVPSVLPRPETAARVVRAGVPPAKVEPPSDELEPSCTCVCVARVWGGGQCEAQGTKAGGGTAHVCVVYV